jgi:4-carboxymuconolactone decarboxylase
MIESPKANSRLPELREDSLSKAQSEILKRVETGRGRVPTPYRVWIQSPELAEPMHGLGSFLSKNTSLSTREREIIILHVARHWHADYVFEVHAREALEAGLSEKEIAAIRAGSLPNFTDERELSICGIVRDFARPDPASDDLFNEAVVALGHQGLAEVLALCGYYTSVSLAMKLYRATPPR